MAPSTGMDRGIPKKFIKIARPNNPKIIEGTAAKLFIFTSIKSVHLFFGANSSKYIAAVTPIGNDINRVKISVKNDPISAPFIPACSGSLESPLSKNFVLNLRVIKPLL